MAEQMGGLQKVEHPRTYRRHLQDPTETPVHNIGTVTLCGKVLANSPGSFVGNGGLCENCQKIAQHRGLIPCK